MDLSVPFRDAEQTFLEYLRSVKTIVTPASGSAHRFIEFLGVAIGSRKETIDTFVIPRPLGFISERRGLLDDFTNIDWTTTVKLAVSLQPSTSKALGVIVSAVPSDHDREQETTLFFPLDMLATPSGVGLWAYLSTELSSMLSGNDDAPLMSDRDLERKVRSVGISTRIRGKQYVYSPIPLEVDQWGTPDSCRLFDPAIRRTLVLNRYKDGLDFGQIHPHEALALKSVDEGQKALMLAVGEDWVRLPSEIDVLNLLNSEKHMERLGLRDSRLAFTGVLATTAYEDAGGLEKLGASYLEIDPMLDHLPTLKTLVEVTNKAYNTKKLDDRVKFFSLMKELTTETPPKYTQR